MKLKCIFGHKLASFRDVSTKDPNLVPNSSFWGAYALKELYSDMEAHTFYMNASCVNCGMHFSLKKEIPKEIANFLYKYYQDKQNKMVSIVREEAKNNRKKKK